MHTCKLPELFMHGSIDNNNNSGTPLHWYCTVVYMHGQHSQYGKQTIKSLNGKIRVVADAKPSLPSLDKHIDVCLLTPYLNSLLQFRLVAMSLCLG
jgi:hypothetical protein